MHDVTTLTADAIQQAHARAADPGVDAAAEGMQVSTVVRKLFVLLQGSYGSLFVSKFATGLKDGQGRDKGVRAAMSVWQARLGHFPADVLEAAAYRVMAENPAFPPNLPQIEAACQAVMPRQTYAQQQGLTALPPPAPAQPVQVSLQERNDGKDWARRIVARLKNGDTSICRYTAMSARMALGLEAKL